MAKWISIFGPFAAMYGRDIEQYLMRPDRGSLVPEWDFNESVHGVKWTLEGSALTTAQCLVQTLLRMVQ